MGNLGSSDVDSRLEEQLIDGILYAFQEQTQEVHVVLTHCAAVVDFLVLSEGSKHWWSYDKVVDIAPTGYSLIWAIWRCTNG